MSDPRCTKRGRSRSYSPDKSSKFIVLIIAQYAKTICSIFTPVLLILLAFTMLYVLQYVLEKENKDLVIGHIFFCTLGLSYLQGMAIVIINMVPQGCKKAVQRVYAHGFLHVLGVAANITGIIFIAEHGNHLTVGNINTGTTHSVLGILASVLSVATLISGPYVVAFDWPINFVHIAFGLPSFILSSICLGYAIESIGEKEKYPLGESRHSLTIILLYVYTGFVVFCIVLRFVLRITIRIICGAI